MKRILITLLFLLAAGFIFSQSNATFSTIDVRTRETFRGPMYVYDTTYFKPSSVNIPFLDAGEPLGWFLTTSKGAEAKLVRVRWGSILDSIPTPASYWTMDGDTLESDYVYAIGLNGNLITDHWTHRYSNTVLGMEAVNRWGITDAYNGVYIGDSAGWSHATGYNEVYIGSGAGKNEAGSAHDNVFIGFHAGYNASGVANNTFIGSSSGLSTTTGSGNSFLGYSSAWLNTTGGRNTAVGYFALGSNKANSRSTAVGYMAMNKADDRVSGRDTYNTAVGYETMQGSSTAANNTGQYNTAVGAQALDAMTTASFNTIYGYDAGGGLTTGDSNILIGTSAGSALTTQSDKLYIENTNSSTPLIWGDFRADSLRLNGDLSLTADLHYEDTFWDDLTTPATAAKIGANSKPVFDYDTLGLKWDNTPVDTANAYIVLTYQLPHRYKSGTSVYLHVHYLQNSGADTSEFFIAKYKWTDMGEARVANYTRIQTNNQTVYPYTSGSLHQLAAFPAISGSGHTESSVLQIVLGCYSDADLYTLDIDIHFEIDKPGSDGQFP